MGLAGQTSIRYMQGLIDSKEKRYPSNFTAKLKIVTNSKQTMALKQLMLLKIVPFCSWFEFC